jgi:D-3-phosphoglycerate dehydrogenase
MITMKVLFTDSYNEQTYETIRKAGHDVTVKIGMLSAELIDCVEFYDVLCVRSGTKLTKEILKAAKKLKLIVRGGVGLDNVDVVAAREFDIKVVNTPDANTISTAEFCFGMILACARKLPQGYTSVNKGNWDRKAYRGVELFGKTLGIVGLGRIGGEVAKRASSFGMDVVAFDPYVEKTNPSPLRGEGRVRVAFTDLNSLLATSDFISLHVPLTNETKHILNKDRLTKTKKGVYIINCARGGLIDEVALADLIRNEHIAGAALDVFEEEPPKNNRLLNMPNVIYMPHVGGNTFEAQNRIDTEVAKIVIKFAEKSSR